ncbi:MAG: hypothetical protein ACJAQT_001587 [Akkermansiaceae bacterium]
MDRGVSPNGETILTIRGQKRPGFFIIFGLIFGGIPAIMLIAIIFGTPDPDNGAGMTVFTILFLVPFLLIGAGTFLSGLFLWLGRTLVQYGPRTDSVRRELFGKAFQTK